jgi:hypothetical protein
MKSFDRKVDLAHIAKIIVESWHLRHMQRRPEEVLIRRISYIWDSQILVKKCRLENNVVENGFWCVFLFVCLNAVLLTFENCIIYLVNSLTIFLWAFSLSVYFPVKILYILLYNYIFICFLQWLQVWKIHLPWWAM